MKKPPKAEQEATLLQQMRELALERDTESAHGKADDLLCEYLRLLGKADIVEAYDQVDKWYA